MDPLALDPDLVVVHRAVEHSAPAAASLNRLIAKSGSVYLQRDLLLCTAETLMSALGKRLREAEDASVVDLERFFGMQQYAEPDATGVQKEEPGTADPATTEQATTEQEKTEPEKTEPEKIEPEPAKRCKTTVRDMKTFLAKPTKLQNTLRQFHRRYGCGECRRQDLIELLMTCEDVVHHTGVGKLFHPPKGFLQAVFEKTEAGAVRAARPWLLAAELASEPASDQAVEQAGEPAAGL